LVIVRHGQVEANVDQRYLGLRDDPLTPLGEAQAEAVAQAVGSFALAAVYSSPLRRSLATAEAIGRLHGLVPITDERLREMSFGHWEGLSRPELEGRSPADAALLARWEEDPGSHPPPDGESLELVQRRVLDFVNERAAEWPRGTVGMVTHVGPIKALLCALLGLPLAASRRVFLDPATISVVDWGPRPLLRLLNDHAHLGWTNARWMRAGGR
jgi:ribonuclease H / adenosylcobalamin/alpha-ribazole phosphatase